MPEIDQFDRIRRTNRRNRQDDMDQKGSSNVDSSTAGNRLTVPDEAEVGAGRERDLRSWYRVVFSVVAVGMTVFQLYTGLFGAYIANTQRAAHLTFALIIAFLLFKLRPSANQEKTPWYDFVLIAAAVFAYGYLALNGTAISQRFSFVTPLSVMDYIVGLIGLVVLLEATRRVVGPALLVIVLILLAHTLLGRNLPGALGHRGYDLPTVVEQLFFTTSGVFGIPLGVSATYIFLFILFGKFLEKTGGGDFFLNIALAGMGRFRGGPAKTAVIGSSLMASISGSAVANTATTGSITIPMMKRTGYDKTFAGAVEATASAGGQIMPPVMGASAFIIASFLGIPYGEVALAAVLPAIAYYVAVFAQVDFRAARTGLRGLRRNELPRFWPVMRSGVLYFTPVVVIIVLLVQGASPTRAGLFAIAATVVVALILMPNGVGPKNLVRIAEGAGRGVLEVAIATAAAGAIVGLLSQTGLNTRFSSIMLSVTGDSLLLTLVFTAIASIILGMGLPTVAAYIVQVPLTIPALIAMGVAPVSAHLFIFYFASMSAITPPVALAAFTASAISGGNPMRTGVIAVRLGLAAFLAPFVFVYSPALLIGFGTLPETITVTVSLLVGVWALAAAVEGWLITNLAVPLRLVLAAGALTLVIPGLATDVIGLILLAAVVVAQWLRNKRIHENQESAGEPSQGEGGVRT